ncbi:MAG: PhoH family protein, partial [Paucibacter sp.]|nr:PhoH family protein [Roseateles sp.]
MPLPKPPIKRASRLESSAFEANLAVSKPDAPRKSAPPIAAAKQAPAISQAAPVASTKPAVTSKAATPAATTQDVQTTFAPPRVTGAKARPTVAPAAKPEPTAQPKTSKSKKATAAGAPKLFVLDTNVLMHDPMCLFRFEEHDIYLPMITLEEMDGHKKGMTEVARNVRQVSRELDNLAGGLKSSGLEEMAKGLPLNHTGHREAGGKLFFQTQLVDAPLPPGLPQGKADNQILAVVTALKLKEPGREVVLVSKDINMRIKARALGLPTEDYRNDKTLEDSDLLYTGVQALPADFWERHGKTMESWSQGGITFYRISGPLVPSLLVNELIYLEAPGAAPLYAKVLEITGKTAVLRTLKDYGNQKHKVWGVTARNREQNFALNLLMDPDCDFVTLTGTAGTGKTLMTLAAGLS